MAFLNFHKDLVHSKLAFTIISSLLGNVKVEQQDKTYSFYTVGFSISLNYASLLQYR